MKKREVLKYDLLMRNKLFYQHHFAIYLIGFSG
jgi:hypothetical protein